MYQFTNPLTQLTVNCGNFKEVEKQIVLISKPTFPNISLSNVHTFCDSAGKDWWEYIVGDLTFPIEKLASSSPPKTTNSTILGVEAINSQP